MIIMGTPKAEEIDNYYMTDSDDEIWALSKAGFYAKYIDNGIQYFKSTEKLRRFIKKFNKLKK